MLVQLGGLEPPTSCSTDRRSNQLSYNCILTEPRLGGLKEGNAEGGWTGRKLGATACFGKAAARGNRALNAVLFKTKPGPRGPGYATRNGRAAQAAGL